MTQSELNSLKTKFDKLMRDMGGSDDPHCSGLLMFVDWIHEERVALLKMFADVLLAKAKDDPATLNLVNEIGSAFNIQIHL